MTEYHFNDDNMFGAIVRALGDVYRNKGSQFIRWGDPSANNDVFEVFRSSGGDYIIRISPALASKDYKDFYVGSLSNFYITVAPEQVTNVTIVDRTPSNQELRKGRLCLKPFDRGHQKDKVWFEREIRRSDDPDKPSISKVDEWISLQLPDGSYDIAYKAEEDKKVNFKTILEGVNALLTDTGRTEYNLTDSGGRPFLRLAKVQGEYMLSFINPRNKYAHRVLISDIREFRDFLADKNNFHRYKKTDKAFPIYDRRAKEWKHRLTFHYNGDTVFGHPYIWVNLKIRETGESNSTYLDGSKNMGFDYACFYEALKEYERTGLVRAQIEGSPDPSKDVGLFNCYGRNDAPTLWVNISNDPDAQGVLFELQPSKIKKLIEWFEDTREFKNKGGEMNTEKIEASFNAEQIKEHIEKNFDANAEEGCDEPQQTSSVKILRSRDGEKSVLLLDDGNILSLGDEILECSDNLAFLRENVKTLKGLEDFSYFRTMDEQLIAQKQGSTLYILEEEANEIDDCVSVKVIGTYDIHEFYGRIIEHIEELDNIRLSLEEETEIDEEEDAGFIFSPPEPEKDASAIVDAVLTDKVRDNALNGVTDVREVLGLNLDKSDDDEIVYIPVLSPNGDCRMISSLRDGEISFSREFGVRLVAKTDDQNNLTTFIIILDGVKDLDRLSDVILSTVYLGSSEPEIVYTPNGIIIIRYISETKQVRISAKTQDVSTPLYGWDFSIIINRKDATEIAKILKSKE